MDQVYELTADQAAKLERLRSGMRDLGRVAVAFSAGVDSTLLLKVAYEELGGNVLAVTARSASIPSREIEEAKEFCEVEGIRHTIVETHEFDIKGFDRNPPDRCYLCKREILARIRQAALARGFEALVEGSNLDDGGDYRPGSRAVSEAGVTSPLRDAGLRKADVRALARHLGLAVWDKPAFACLNTRFEYGDLITPERLAMVDAAEEELRELGFEQVRVRVQGATARIEVPSERIERLMRSDVRKKAVRACKDAGFGYVSLDLQGYRTGSMNETLETRVIRANGHVGAHSRLNGLHEHDCGAGGPDPASHGAAGARGSAEVNSFILGQPFMKSFVRMCDDGWAQGWHERNGGNLSYRLTDGEVAACRPYFDVERTDWVEMGVQADNLRGACFATTGAGRFMQNVELDPAFNVGIVEINGAGDAWRIVWGLRDGGRPTSEFPSHFMYHSIRSRATGGACRVVYHSHPIDVIALTKVLPLDAREITRALWKAMTECVMVFPQGVGVVPCMVPGGVGIAKATSEMMETYDAVIWAQHGLFCTGADFDSTFGLMHAIVKAAGIHGTALAMNGGSSDFAQTISDDELRAIAHDLGLTINEAFLD